MPGQLKHVIESGFMRLEKWSLSSVYGRLSHNVRRSVYSNHVHFLEHADDDLSDDENYYSAGQYSLRELRSLVAGNYDAMNEKQVLDLRCMLFGTETNFVFRARYFKLINKKGCKLKPILDPTAGLQMIQRLKMFLQLIDTLHIPAIFGFELRNTSMGMLIITNNENYIDAKKLGITAKRYSSIRNVGRALLAVRDFQIGFIVGSSSKNNTPLERVSLNKICEPRVLGIITNFLF